ncbi:MAG: YchF/TatD family DNA exonuclease [Deltaproteobacteria bacterium]|nr:YchF/TatD family DNA exonuclease [Deltaproteobacteria bacterium]
MEPLFDTHAHLDFEDFRPELPDVLSRARAAGVEKIVTIGLAGPKYDPAAAVALAAKEEGIWATVGVHPHDALLGLDYRAPFEAEPKTGFLAEWNAKADRIVGELRGLACDPKVVAIGEAGLDYHYRFAPHAVQKMMLERMIELANETGKPLVIHDREAHEDTYELVKHRLRPGLSGTFHCFSGDADFAKAVLGIGFYISVPGVVTFKNAAVLHGVVRSVPVERILLETDCPYLAPIPHRGRRNEPAFMVETARRVAELKGLSLDDVARMTTLNAMRLFRLGAHGPTAIAYAIRDSLYLNITNRCTLACKFCAKQRDYTVKGHYLRLDDEPSAQEVLALVGPQAGGFREVVFCGFGEPMLRIDLIKEVAAELKKRGVPVRVNTDGLANLVHGRDVTTEFAGLVDVYSVSLNAADAETYARICPSEYGESAYAAVREFILAARRNAHVVATAVALPRLDIQAIRRAAEDELGVEFRVREFNEVG